LINFNREKLALIIYSLIALVGITIGSLFVSEKQQNKQLLTSHKALLTNTVHKTLLRQLKSSLAVYPLSAQALNENWQTFAADILLLDRGKQFYPHPFLGNNSRQLSSKWQQFNTIDEQLSEGEKKRAIALQNLRLALQSKEQKLTKINTHTNAYFHLVTNYQLSAISEVISALSFLTLDNKEQWNSALSKQILLSGSVLFKPVSYYIFKENTGFSRADIAMALSIMKPLLESANLPSFWLNKNSELMLTPPYSYNTLGLENFTVINDKSIYVKLSSTVDLIMPFQAETALESAVVELKKQGVLAPEDSITIPHKKEKITLDNIALTINKPNWKALAQEQKLFFIGKFTLLIISIVSLMFVTRLMNNFQKKKQSYLAMREHFISLVSHELKTPLAAIRVMAETVKKREEKQLSLKDYPVRIVNEVDRLWLMVDNLLSMNRLKANEINLNIQPLKLEQIIHYCSQKLSEYSNKQIDINVQLPADMTINADELLIELVFSNIISNAIKYNDKTVVTLDFHYDQATKSLTIIDNACGIDKTQWLTIFNEFERIPQAKAISGHGIGLSLSKLVLKQHQADIKIISSTSQGTTWKITF
jgi:signal transduction histidine kinase